MSEEKETNEEKDNEDAWKNVSEKQWKIIREICKGIEPTK